MGKIPHEGSSPESSQTTFERFGQWISRQGENLQQIAGPLSRVAKRIGEKVGGTLGSVNSGWTFPSSGLSMRRMALPAALTLAGGLAVSNAARADYLFVDSYYVGFKLINLADGSETTLTGLRPTTYGFIGSGFHDDSTGKLVSTYFDSILHTSSEGVFVIDDITGTPALSITSGFDEDPGRINHNPNTGSITFADDAAAYLCTDYEDSSSCDTYSYPGTNVTFEADEDGTGRGVIVDPSGYDVIDLATGVSELSGSLTWGENVTIDRDTGYAFIADTNGMQLLVVDLNAATPSVVGTETFSFGPVDLFLYTNSNTGNKELAVIGLYYTTELNVFEVSGSTLNLVGSDSYTDTVGIGKDILAVDDVSNANYLYAAISYASSIKRVDLSSYTFDGASYGSSGEMVVYIPSPVACTDADGDGACSTDDCDDSDGSVQTELAYYVDGDGDGDGAGAAVWICEAITPSGYSEVDTDCDDGDASVQTEANYYPDGDGDGDGAGAAVSFCEASSPLGYSDNDSDCDDADASAYDGATEVCDGDQENCALAYADQGLPTYTYYRNNDGDGYGDSAYSNVACGPFGAYTVTVGGDCDDSNAYAYPSSPYEVSCYTDIADRVDLNCDLVYPSECLDDADGDGWDSIASGGIDCDDTNAMIYPGANEHCDGVDEDCDYVIDNDPVDGESYCRDNDGDGYGDTTDCEVLCSASAPYTVLESAGSDPDDSDANTYPGAEEIADGKDNDGDDFIDECLWVEGSDWTPEAACTHMDVYAGAEISAWATEGGFYTLEYIDAEEDEYIITFHGVEGEIEAVRGEHDIAFFTGPEGGGAAWISGSIGRMGWREGISTFTIVDEGDAAVHWAVIESQVDNIAREDNVRVLEGEVVVMNSTTGEIDEELTTASEVLEALEEDTGDDDTGDDDTGDTDDDTGDTDDTDDTVDSGDDTADTDHPDTDDTGNGNGGGCNECSTTGQTEAPNTTNVIAILSLLGLAGLRRRGSRTEAKLSDDPESVRDALGRALKSLVG